MRANLFHLGLLVFCLVALPTYSISNLYAFPEKEKKKSSVKKKEEKKEKSKDSSLDDKTFDLEGEGKKKKDDSLDDKTFDLEGKGKKEGKKDLDDKSFDLEGGGKGGEFDLEGDKKDKGGFDLEGKDKGGFDLEGDKKDKKEKKKEEKKGEKKEGEKEVEGPWYYSGNFSLAYRFRTSDSETDQDIWGSLGLNISYREKRKEIMKLVLQGTGKIDLDSSLQTIFPSLTDTYSNEARFELYTAYVDYYKRSISTRFRAGRQHRWEVMGVHFDGLSTRWEPEKGRLYAEVFGGVPIRYHESSRTGNWLAGTALGVKFSRYFTTEVSYIHVRDEASREDRNFSDDYWALSAKIFPIKNLAIRGKYSLLEEKPRRGEVHSRYILPRWRLYTGVSFIWQSETLRDFSTEFSQYYPVLLETHPYIMGKVYVMMGITPQLTVRVEGLVREVLDDDDEGRFNHSFQNGNSNISFSDFLIKGLTLSAGFSVWNASNEDDIYALHGEISYKPNPELKLAVGSRYYLWKYSFNLNRERTRTRTIYFKYRWKFYPHIYWRASYEAERAELGTTHVLFTSLAYVF